MYLKWYALYSSFLLILKIKTLKWISKNQLSIYQKQKIINWNFWSISYAKQYYSIHTNCWLKIDFIRNFYKN